MLKVFMATLKVIVSVPNTFNIKFPGFASVLLLNMNVLNMDFIQLLPISCYGSTDYIQSVAMTTIMPFVVLVSLINHGIFCLL